MKVWWVRGRVWEVRCEEACGGCERKVCERRACAKKERARRRHTHTSKDRIGDIHTSRREGFELWQILWEVPYSVRRYLWGGGGGVRRRRWCEEVVVCEEVV